MILYTQRKYTLPLFSYIYLHIVNSEQLLCRRKRTISQFQLLQDKTNPNPKLPDLKEKEKGN